ncbi:MAG: DNA ligase D [Candidatus Doudnabacteria bacterium]|nr:DNA ligase D [Candidatus Doudnabacteria bacterium]
MPRIKLDQIPSTKSSKLIKPMLATLVDEPFNRKGWIFEIKWDGFRALAQVARGKTLLYSRNLLSFNELFSPIVKSLAKIKHDVLLDGEVVVLDDNGRSNFQLLQNYQQTKHGRLTFFVFDILSLDGHDLTGLPLLERKKILKQVLPKATNIKYSDHVLEQGVSFFEAAQKQTLEGIIGKDGASTYKPAQRTADWVKIKTHMRQEAVIGGFTQGRGSRKKFGALVLGVYEGNNFIYIGHTGGGFNDKLLTEVYAQLKPLAQTQSPFVNTPKTNAPATWVAPKLVCEVSFSEWTTDGHMRQPIFLGLRPDKKAKEVVRELPKRTPLRGVQAAKQSKPGDRSPRAAGARDGSKISINGQELKLTNLDKIYWPKEKYTKGDLIDYYQKIAPFILPYLKDRPESLNRHPNGITGKNFFQKDVGDMPPAWVRTKKIHSESNNAKINYLVCQDEATLIFMANLGCVEINPWNSRIQSQDKPDYLVIDLDPEKISFDKVILVAQYVHKLLDSINVPNYCKTSGATGLHIYVPLGAKYTYDQAKEFAHLVAIIINRQLPDITSIERMPAKRQKRVYLDFLQNRKGQTLAAAYSVRPKPGATVSTPLTWSEVRLGLDPAKFTIKTIFARIKKKQDLFRPVLGKGADLNKALSKIAKLS